MYWAFNPPATIENMLFSVIRESTAPAPHLVLLHGLGADEHDLLGLAPYLDSRFKIESVRAPKRSPWGGYSWFDIDFREEGIVVAEEDVRASLGQLIEFLASKKEPVWLAGFSQGAMMSLGVLLERPDLVRGVVAMSGRLLPFFRPSEGPKPPVLATHGTYDPVVPVEDGRQAAAALKELGVEVDYREYPMQHEIDGDCLSDIDSWLKNRLD